MSTVTNSEVIVGEGAGKAGRRIGLNAFAQSHHVLIGFRFARGGCPAWSPASTLRPASRFRKPVPPRRSRLDARSPFP